MRGDAATDTGESFWLMRTDVCWIVRLFSVMAVPWLVAGKVLSDVMQYRQISSIVQQAPSSRPSSSLYPLFYRQGRALGRTKNATQHYFSLGEQGIELTFILTRPVVQQAPSSRRSSLLFLLVPFRYAGE